MYALNIYRNVTNPLVFSSVTINQWFNHIKSSDYSQTISQARLGQVDYDLTKSQLPAITYNFTYNNYKKDANVIDGTGLLYIDIDSQDFDISKIHTDKVYSYYRSFGGVGYSLIIRVNDLTLNNFKPTYKAIIEDLGLTSYVDKNAIKASQFNVLSYDPNIFINESSFIYNSINENVSHPQ